MTDHSRTLALWLWSVVGMIFAMAIIGAITRLTESGLSMVEWRPLIGTLPPLTADEWQRVFDLYRVTPEYIHKNAGMTLDEFKLIFFWEWFHRLWGRLIGLVYAVPLLIFWVRGMIPAGWKPKLIGLLILGGAQGVMGYVMVLSGLVDEPAVSHYRLAAHLSLAILCMCVSLWFALDLGRRAQATNAPAAAGRWVTGFIILLSVTIIWGAFVAGLDAGKHYNEWPMMDGHFFPSAGLSMIPAWLNPIENIATVQFIHRWIAGVTLVAALALKITAIKQGWTGFARSMALAVGGMALVQFALGIVTLLSAVAIPLGAAHQGGALILIGFAIALRWSLARSHSMQLE
ncbi:MAG: COX15/CtaA family protein [Alphaproteobacteria bacterium]